MIITIKRRNNKVIYWFRWGVGWEALGKGSLKMGITVKI